MRIVGSGGKDVMINYSSCIIGKPEMVFNPEVGLGKTYLGSEKTELLSRVTIIWKDAETPAIGNLVRDSSITGGYGRIKL